MARKEGIKPIVGMEAYVAPEIVVIAQGVGQETEHTNILFSLLVTSKVIRIFVTLLHRLHGRLLSQATPRPSSLSPVQRGHHRLIRVHGGRGCPTPPGQSERR